MKYVSDISLYDNTYKSLVWDSHHHQPVLRVMDSETGAIEEMKRTPRRFVLGCDAKDRLHYVVSLQCYQVKFFEYVKKVRVYHRVYDVPLCDCNIWTGHRFNACEPVMYSQDKQTIVVTFESGTCKLAGECDSVVLLTYSGNVEKFMSLYDLFADLCKNSKICLMSYKTVQLFSLMGAVSLTLEIDQSTEARRYFTKMYMDVMSK